MFILKFFFLVIAFFFLLGLLMAAWMVLAFFRVRGQLMREFRSGQQASAPRDDGAVEMQKCPQCGMFVDHMPRFNAQGECDICGKTLP